MVFTLKHAPHSLEEKEFLTDANTILTAIEDVTLFEQLRQVSPKNDYRFGFSMEFADQAAYTRYNDHLDHVAFVSDRRVPEVEAFDRFQHINALAADGSQASPRDAMTMVSKITGIRAQWPRSCRRVLLKTIWDVGNCDALARSS